MPKVRTKWKTNRGSDTVFPTNAGYFLLLEDGGHILLEDGHKILLEDSVVTPKPKTVWKEG